MSFRCEVCDRPIGKYQKPITVVTQTRDKVYPKRFAEDGKTVIDNGGKGYETVKEIHACQECYALLV